MEIFLVKRDNIRYLAIFKDKKTTYLNVESPDMDKSLTRILLKLDKKTEVVNGILSDTPTLVYRGITISIPCVAGIKIFRDDDYVAYYGEPTSDIYQPLTTNTLYAILRDRLMYFTYQMRDIDMSQETKDTADSVVYIGGFS